MIKSLQQGQPFGRVPFWVLACILLQALVFARPALADLVPNNPDHDPSQNAVLASLMKKGAQVYYIGSHNGLDGWLLTQDKQVRFGYTTADKTSLVLGMLFDADGTNISAAQVKQIAAGDPKLKPILDQMSKAAGKVASTGDVGKPGAQNASANTPSSAAPAVTTNSAPHAVSSVGDKLLSELNAAPGVTLGQASAPQLLMVMDANCPHCKATWRMLREAVMTGKLRVRMIPVGELGTPHETQGALLLQSSDPFSVWDRHVAGDKAALAGTPDQAHLNQIMANNDLIIRWNIATTPYLVYRDRDGKIKIIQGEPSDPAGLVAAIAP